MRDRRELLRATLALYDQSPLIDRWFVRIRAVLSDLIAVEAHAPRRGTILDIGCGHGLLTNLLALGSPDRTVLGIDIDPKKIAAAQRTVRGRANIQFRVADALSPPGGPYQAITVADVLYLLPAPAQRRVLVNAFRLLEPGGVLLWKTQVRRPRWKYLITYGQEWLMTHLGPTTGTTLCFLDLEESLAALDAAGFHTEVHPLRSWRPYPDVLFIAKKPDTGS